MQRDRLKYTANVIGVSLLLFIFTSAGVRWFLSFLLGQYVTGASFESPTGVSELIIQGMYFLHTTASLCVPVLFLRKESMRRKQIPIFKRKDADKTLPFILVFLGMIPLTSLLGGLFEKAIASWFAIEEVRRIAFPDSIIAIILLFFYTCVIPAVFEEVLFRGYIQKKLMPYGAVFAIGVTSALFAFLHARLYQIPSVFLLSVALGYISFLQKGIRTSTLLHFINNAFAFILEYIAWYMNETAAVAFVAVMFVIFEFLGIAGLLVLWKKQRTPLHENKRTDRITRAEKMLSAPFFTLALVIILIAMVMR